MELNYKASNIAKAEQAIGSNFFETLEGLGSGTPSFTSLLMILRAGGLTEDEADKMLDDKGITVALEEAVNALGKAGFLAKMGVSLNEVMKDASEKKALQSTGNATKA